MIPNASQVRGTQGWRTTASQIGACYRGAPDPGPPAVIARVLIVASYNYFTRRFYAQDTCIL